MRIKKIPKSKLIKVVDPITFQVIYGAKPIPSKGNWKKYSMSGASARLQESKAEVKSNRRSK